jgi:hypothetical protein
MCAGNKWTPKPTKLVKQQKTHQLENVCTPVNYAFSFSLSFILRPFLSLSRSVFHVYKLMMYECMRGSLFNEKLHNLYYSPNIIRVIKSRWMIWAVHVPLTEEMKNAYKMFIEVLEGKRRNGRKIWYQGVNRIFFDSGQEPVSGLHKRRRIFWVPEWPFVSQEGLCSLE